MTLIFEETENSSKTPGNKISQSKEKLLKIFISFSGTLGYVILAKSWQDTRILPYDLVAALQFSTFTAQFLVEGLMGRRDTIWKAKGFLLAPLTLMSITRILSGWPILGHLAETLAIALIQWMDKNMQWRQKCLFSIPVILTLPFMIEVLNGKNPSDAFWALAIGLIFPGFLYLIKFFIDRKKQEIFPWDSNKEKLLHQKAKDLFKIYFPEKIKELDDSWDETISKIKLAFNSGKWFLPIEENSFPSREVTQGIYVKNMIGFLVTLDLEISKIQNPTMEEIKNASSKVLDFLKIDFLNSEKKTKFIKFKTECEESFALDYGVTPSSFI